MELRDGACETGVDVCEFAHDTLCASVGIRKVRHGRFKLIFSHFLVDLLGIATEPKLAGIRCCVFL